MEPPIVELQNRLRVFCWIGPVCGLKKRKELIELVISVYAHYMEIHVQFRHSLAGNGLR